MVCALFLTDSQNFNNMKYTLYTVWDIVWWTHGDEYQATYDSIFLSIFSASLNSTVQISLLSIFLCTESNGWVWFYCD